MTGVNALDWPGAFNWNGLRSQADEGVSGVPGDRVSLLEAGDFNARHLPLGRLDLPPPGVVHLWFMDLDRLGSPLALAEGQHSPLNPRQERTARRFYLRLLLGAYLGIPGRDVRISRLVKGKPVLDRAAHGVPLDFSMAGSHGCCLFGICSAGQIGVDLEARDRRAGRPLALVNRYFSAGERQSFGALPVNDLDRAFMHTWACKEAVVKAAGHGIANQLCRFSVSTDPDAPAAMLDMEGDDPGRWRLAMVRPDEHCVGSVALRHDSLSLEGYLLNRRP